ncbi:MAG: efflux RND transporter periplasmic adaptor subunit [Candidatus Aminicenantaceae bacterium]
MKKYALMLCLGILSIAILLAGISCRDQSPENGSGEAAADMDSESRFRPGKTAAPGAGITGGRQRAGDRGLGRNREITLSQEEKEMVEPETVPAEFRSIKESFTAPGKVMAHPQRKAIVSYAFPARIAEIHVQIGDWVKTGDELVTLQSEEVGNAKSEFYKTLADYELAQVNYEREQSLFDGGVGAKKNFLAAQADLKVARASLTAAEKKLHVLGFTEPQIEEIKKSHQINPIITLHAPIHGKVLENKAILGQMVDQESEILVLLDPRILCVDADIYEKDIARIRMGQKVEVAVPAFLEETFPGEIRYISDVLNEDTRTITVRTEVQNSEMRLKAGMFANVRIFLNHREKALVIPKEAVLEDKGETVVFLQREDKYLLQTVQTGAADNGFVAILSGLSEGDQVVTQGNFQLKSKLYEEILKQGQIH